MTKDLEKYPYADQGDRLRKLRLAEGGMPGRAFGERIGAGQSGYSQFETGARAIPRPKVQAMAAGPKAIPGFDALWLWTGDKRGLGYDLRRRIDAIEEDEAAKGQDEPLPGTGTER